MTSSSSQITKKRDLKRSRRKRRSLRNYARVNKHKKNKRKSKHNDSEEIDEGLDELEKMQAEMEKEHLDGDLAADLDNPDDNIEKLALVEDDDDDEIRIPEAEEVEDLEIDCKTEHAKVAQIIDEMAACIQADKESNENKKPALKKLSYSTKLLMSLKDFKVQDLFLNYGG